MPSGENKAKKRAPSSAEKQEKLARVKAEISRLAGVLSGVDESQREIAAGLIVEAANMRITLEDLRDDLDSNGWVEMFQQSEKVAPYEKKRAKAEIYLNMNPNYQKIVDKLLGLLPEPEKGGDDDGFETFAGKRA